MPKPLKVAFAGTPQLAAVVLQKLLDTDWIDICHVFTQPDRPAGRGKKITASPVKTLAETNQLPLHQPRSPAELDAVLLEGMDVFLVAAYGLLLSDAVLEQPRAGAINVHTSLLPRWRGAAPIQRAIEAGDELTGITIMQMDNGLDTGDILMQRECRILPTDTSASLHDRLAVLGGDLLVECLDSLSAGKLVARTQDDTLATYAKKISRTEAEIDWNRPSAEIERKVRAFNPAPVCFTELNGVPMRIWNLSFSDNSHCTLGPGEVTANPGGGFDVMCADRRLTVNRLQLPGKKSVSAREFINGHSSFLRYAKHA